MSFSPRQTEILVAIAKLQEEGKGDITLERLREETSVKDVQNISRIIAGIKNRKKLFKRETHNRKVVFLLNPDAIATSGLVARILLTLKTVTRVDHITPEDFKKIVLSRPFFQKSGKDENYLDRVIRWSLLPKAKYARVADESPNHITASDRISGEIEYLERIAWPDEEEANH